MTDEPGQGLRRVRLAWRWKDSGISGSGPWTHRFDLVEAWFESLVRRSGERVDHWIEEQPVDGDVSTGEARDDARTRDLRADARDLSPLA